MASSKSSRGDRLKFHVVYVSTDMDDAMIEACDVAVGEHGDLLFLGPDNEVERQVAAGQWIEWRVLYDGNGDGPRHGQ